MKSTDIGQHGKLDPKDNVCIRNYPFIEGADHDFYKIETRNEGYAIIDSHCCIIHKDRKVIDIISYKDPVTLQLMHETTIKVMSHLPMFDWIEECDPVEFWKALSEIQEYVNNLLFR